jgi:nicotinamide-nucleotide amidase
MVSTTGAVAGGKRRSNTGHSIRACGGNIGREGLTLKRIAQKMSSLEQEIGDLLRQKKLTLGVVESATGGLISHLITNVPGSSDYYLGSITSYSNEAKIKLVGVKAATLSKYGAVSPQVAEGMAQGGRKVLAVDICLSDTGIAGPGGATPGKPAGLFYIGMSHQGGTFSQKHIFGGDREQNKRSAAEAALIWLKEYLTGLK